MSCLQYSPTPTLPPNVLRGCGCQGGVCPPGRHCKEERCAKCRATRVHCAGSRRNQGIGCLCPSQSQGICPWSRLWCVCVCGVCVCVHGHLACGQDAGNSEFCHHRVCPPRQASAQRERCIERRRISGCAEGYMRRNILRFF